MTLVLVQLSKHDMYEMYRWTAAHIVLNAFLKKSKFHKNVDLNVIPYLITW